MYVYLYVALCEHFGTFLRASDASTLAHFAGIRGEGQCRDGYVGSGGSEWVGGETDSDDDYYFPSGGSDGDDCDAYD